MHGPIETRNARILEFHPLVRSIARRVARRIPGADPDELTSAGTLGLIDAIERFDPSLGVPLQAYVAIRVRGAILDAIRADDWAPRRARAAGNRIQEVRATLEKKRAGPAAAKEVAESLGMDLPQYERARAETSRRLVSLDDGGELPLQVPSSDPDPLFTLATAEQRSLLARALVLLEPRDARVIAIVSLQEGSLKEAGAALGVSESRACQLHTRAIERLRVAIGGLRA